MSNEILDYIGINMDKEYKSLVCDKPKFSVSKTYDNDLLYKVYKLISVKKLEILVGNTDRTTDIKERYNLSIPINQFIKENPEEFEKLSTLATKSEIENIENMQKELQSKTPYFVKYDRNYVWQIYYSKEDDKYFMLFPAKEGETSALFYLIKKKLEKKDTQIFVPICKADYDYGIITDKEVNDIENYMWLLTKEWPIIYEVEKDKRLFYITGKIQIKGKINTQYRNIIATEEDSSAFYTLIKALFILNTETKERYIFDTSINENGELIFLYNEEEITIENLGQFISKETKKQEDRKEILAKKISRNKDLLDKVKATVLKQNEIYSRQEKQIVMFMECKKSFFKKIKFFFKNTKTYSAKNRAVLYKTEKENKEFSELAKDQEIVIPEYKGTGETHTLSDLVKMCKDNEDVDIEYKNTKADLNAMRLRQKNMESKIKNAEKYIDEIEKHKKSIFEFWRFSNKDELPALNEGNEQEKENKLQASFDLKEDLPKLAEKADALQKQKLSGDECNAIYASRYILKSINTVLTGKDEDKVLSDELKELKKKLKKNTGIEIFGELTEDFTKVKVLKTKQHRENKKNLFSIIKVDAKTTIEDYKNTVEDITRLLGEAYNKITSLTEFDVYYTEKNKDGFVIGEINPTKYINENEKVLYKMRTSKETHMLFFSNIIFYDNYNKTLPNGMDESTEVIVKTVKNKKNNEYSINILKEENLFEAKIQKIRIIEETEN